MSHHNIRQSLRRRRRRLLWGSAPLLLLAMLLAVKLLSLPVSAGLAATAYANGNAGGTTQAGALMGSANVVERYKAHFALGDGFVLHGDFEQARKQFLRALELVPAAESCKVRVNLVLSLEKLGDEQKKGGNTPSAKEFYAQGSEVVAQSPRDCFAPNSENNKDGESAALKDAQERLAQKLSASKDDGDGSSPSDSGTEEDASKPPSDSKQEELAETGKKAQKQRSKSQKLTEDYNDPEPEQYAKPW
ncbi:tetratricopeptide repeat protein [Arthrobacter sp. TMP15]|uniref:tetratricopeptide repeat protein n=1 Tax=Arthrobacter sp. TMP15 TaxID=3140789 RepID=UPI0031BB5F92